MKTIGVLTSGGDAPGMNAAIRAVVRSGIASGMKVMGIKRGYCGLIDGDIEELNIRSVSNIVHRGGTILYSSRSPEFKTEEGMKKAIATCKEFGIEGIVVIGGDGSYRGARDLSLRGIPCIGIPGTIDNDISSTEYTIGYDTAINTCVEMVDKLRDTTQSHLRCSVVEVMGRNAGYLALHTGIAVGATSILVPEIPYDFKKDILDKIEFTKSTGKKHYIIVVAEGVGHSEEITKAIQKETGIESRCTILGHVQRGGTPSGRDRSLASCMGYEAVQLLLSGQGNKVIGNIKNEIVNFDIFEALNMEKPFEYHTYEIANTISI